MNSLTVRGHFAHSSIIFAFFCTQLSFRKLGKLSISVEFVNQVKAMGIQQVLSAPRSSWQRAYIERLIGSIRRELCCAKSESTLQISDLA